MTTPYLSAITNSFRSVGKFLNLLPPETVLMLTSDHGGNDHLHGADNLEEIIRPYNQKVYRST
jgi:phosphopentomutase